MEQSLQEKFLDKKEKYGCSNYRGEGRKELWGTE